MKKIVMTAALVACAAVVTAQTVTSANIVGYAKDTIASGDLIQVLPQFLAGDTGGITLGDAFTGLSDNTQVYLWNGTGYDNYLYGAGAWYDINNNYAPASDVLVPQGLGMWMVDGGAGSVPLASGEVPMSSTITVTLMAGVNIVGNPYPTALELSTIPQSVLSDNDQIYMWNGTGYDNYLYGAGVWYDVNNNYAPSNDVLIPVGSAFWLDCATGGDMVFSKNF